MKRGTLWLVLLVACGKEAPPAPVVDQTEVEAKAKREQVAAKYDQEKREKQAKEQAAWALAEGETSCKAPAKVADCQHHAAYFRQYPDGAHVAQVKEVLLPVQKKLVELKDKENAAQTPKRRAFAAKVKQTARCQSAVVEGDASDTLHTEGCDQFTAPTGADPLFDEGKALGFVRFHNHSTGTAWCSYYLSAYPQQKLWKCNNAGGSWPGP